MFEIEMKFEVKSPKVFNQIGWRKQLAGYRLSDQEMVQQLDVYFDTKTGRLLRNHAALRVRKKDAEYFAVFKTQLDGNYVRTEVKTPLTESQAQEILNGNFTDTSIEAVQAALIYLQGETVYPVLRVENPREVWMIHNRNEGRMSTKQESVKVCFDDVRYTSNGSRGIEEYELELELKEGEAGFLHKLSEALSQQYGLRMVHESKYQRGVQLLNIFSI